MKKKFLALTFALAALFTLASCDNKNENNDSTSTDSNTNESTESENIIYYTTEVLLPNGEKLQSFVSQWCTEKNCFPPEITTDGICKTQLDDKNSYIVHVSQFPSQYTYNPNIYIANKDNRGITIQLVDLKTPTAGDGNLASPFVVTEGGFRVTAELDGIAYYSFTAPKTAKYSLESVAVHQNAEVKINPALGFYGTDDVANIVQYEDGGVGDNFKYEFNAEEGKTYGFAVMATVKDNNYPQTFDVLLSEVK